MAEERIRTEGLSLKELEAQDAGLLPDRVEMRRRRRRRRPVFIFFGDVEIENETRIETRVGDGGSGPG